MPYTMSLGSEHPGYIVILIDQSGSMCSSFGGSVGGSKAEECAKAVNRVLREIGFACTVGTNVKNRVDISVISYGKSGSNAINAFAGNLAQQPIVTMQELVNNVLRIDTVKRKTSDGAGGLVEVDDQFPIWIEPAAVGGTPMTEAFNQAYQLVQGWVSSHPNSFPPTIINITDGAPDSQSSARVSAQKLAQTGTNDGNTLILNAHISEGNAARVELPSQKSELPQGESNAEFLFDISSELPSIIIERAMVAGFTPKQGARGFVYNADAETMIKLLNFGTIGGFASSTDV